MTLDSDDYTILSYANNKNATNDSSKASVTIQGKNNYKDVRKIYFDIAKANQVPSYYTSKVYDGNPANVVVTTNKEVEDLAPVKVVKYFNLEKEEIEAPTEVGKYYINVSITGTDNYNAYDSGFVDYEIEPLDIENVQIGSVDDVQYTENPISLPKPTVKFNSVDLINGIDKDYTISYKVNINKHIKIRS